MLPKEGGFAIKLQETGIVTRAQGMHVAAALRDKGYTTFFSSRLAETGSTSTPRGGGLLTAVSTKYVAEHELLSFTEFVPGKAAALDICTDKGGLILINVHGPQAGCSPWAGRAALWPDIQMYATARSLGGRHPVVIAGDTNIYIDATTNPATDHICVGLKPCGFRRARPGRLEDMTPTLHPFWHRVDTFLVNETLLSRSLREGVWAHGMAHPQVIGSDHLPVCLALRNPLFAAGHAAVPTPYSHTEGRLLPYDAKAAPVQRCLRLAVTAAQDEPPLAPWFGSAEQHAYRSMPAAAANKVFEHLHAAHDALAHTVGPDNRPRRGLTRREETLLRAGRGYKRRSCATTPWQRARRQRTRQMRPNMAYAPRQQCNSRTCYGVHPPGWTHPIRASCRRGWRGKQPPSKRMSAICAHSWPPTASAPSKTSGAATRRTSPSSEGPCEGSSSSRPRARQASGTCGSQTPKRS